MIVTATQIKFYGLSGFLLFIWYIIRIKNQLGKQDGLVFVQYQGMCTLSGWKDLEAMKDFRNSGAHLQAMKQIKAIGSSKSATWETQTMPSWHEATTRLEALPFLGRKK